jgi:anti-sigma-K factor RskA
MSQSTPRDEVQRCRELLAGNVLGDLDEQEEAEIAALLHAPRWSQELHQLELTAAAADLAWGKQLNLQLPESLRHSLQEAAEQYFDGEHGARSFHSTAVENLGTGLAPAAQGLGTSASPSSKSHTSASHTSASHLFGGLRERLAWLACAASLALALGLWTGRSQSTVTSRDGLLALGENTLQIAWQTVDDTLPQVEGDVVWNQSRQAGYMRFVGLPVNDPLVEQYQLWIIDDDRETYPVDGGVFDITDSGESIVPITARLTVGRPRAFAVTIERPGGVVVSDQSRLPLLAPVAASGR